DAPTTAGCQPDDPAAIIFTSGSTGPPKGVLYRHGNFCAQVEQIRDQHAIAAGGIDLACFPLFGLFNSAMGVTTVIPDMDASRPAAVDPARLVAAIQDCGITQSFASPAVWKVMGRYCEQHQIQLPTLRQIFSSGAPVAPEVLARMKAWIHPAGQVHTPYGATEALPVATIEAGEVLAETAERWRAGHGTCVGRRYSEIEWRVIPIVEGPIASLGDVDEVPRGEIGELIVRAPQVTHEYFENASANARAKIDDPGGRWHRMGDVGYLDDQDRFWFCGRMSHRVVTATGTLFTDPCEGIFNTHPDVERSALVGVGPPGSATPVMVIEPARVKNPRCLTDTNGLLAELRALARQHPATAAIEDFLFYPDFPVDVRHNAKIFREQLAEWAGEQLAQQVITRSDRL
ncbi:MAG: AMP-binding protein, partial [Planctomycetaceae bacterium]|nr:AMP-binding protein [Planctomycetaceae bacterium]